MIKEIQQYDNACKRIINEFIKIYFCDDEIKLGDIDWYAVAEDYDGVIQINDHFFNVQQMVEFLRMEAKKEDVFDYYDYSLDQALKSETCIKFDAWLTLKTKT